MKSNIEKIESLMLELEKKDDQAKLHSELLCGIADNIPLAVWAKDMDNRFVYANKVCCDTILGCSGCDVLAMTDTDFELDELSTACISSDIIVSDRRRTGRFIEHARYHDKDVWLDTTKTPRFCKGEIVGTMGFGYVITPKVSPAIRDKYQDTDAFEIPLDASINDELLEMCASKQMTIIPEQ